MWLEPATVAWMTFAVLLAAGAAFLYHETRGTTLWSDEWIWVLNRRGSDLDTFLTPHNEHLSLVPIAIYKLLFATAGLRDYAPYRAIVIAAHLGCAVLLFVYARRRVGSFLALLAAALLLFFGPGWQNVLWPFQVAWLIAIAAGLGALLMLDRTDRIGDIAACALLTIALASSGIGLAIAAGLAAEVLLSRRRLRDAWIVAGPLVVYALWWLSYQSTLFGQIGGIGATGGAGRVRHALVVAPDYASQAAAGTVAALAGLAGQTVPDNTGTLLAWGAPLLIVAVAALIWRRVRLGRFSPRAITLLTVLI